MSGSIAGTDSLNVGATVSIAATLKIRDTAETYKNTDFSGAVFNVDIINNNVTYHKGKFRYIKSSRKDGVITFELRDNMQKTEKTIEPINDGTAMSIMTEIATRCGYTNAFTGFPNSNIVIKASELTDITYRQLINYIAQIAGRFAIFNSSGELLLKTYPKTILEETADVKLNNNTQINISEKLTTITGVAVIIGEGDTASRYLSGAEGYVLELSDNPLITSGNIQSVLSVLNDSFVGMSYYGFNSTSHSDPRVELADTVFLYDYKGNGYPSMIMTYNYTISSAERFSAVSKSDEEQNSSHTDIVTKIVNKANNVAKQLLSKYDEVAANMTELISQGFGMYTTKVKQDDGSYINYMHDAANLEDSSVIWKLTSTGLLVSKNGGTSWAVDSNGNALLNVIIAKGIKAEWIDVDNLYTLSAKIGGFTISDSGLYKGTSNISSDEFGVYVGTDGIRTVDKDGSVIHKGYLSNYRSMYKNQVHTELIESSYGISIRGYTVDNGIPGNHIDFYLDNKLCGGLNPVGICNSKGNNIITYDGKAYLTYVTCTGDVIAGYGTNNQVSLLSHTHNYAGSSSAGGAASSLSYFKCTSTSSVGIDDTSANAIGYVNGISLFGQSDAALYKQVFSSLWAHEILGDYRTGQIALRAKNNGTWQPTRTVLDSSNYKDLIYYLGDTTVGGWAGTSGSGGYVNILRITLNSSSTYANMAIDFSIIRRGDLCPTKVSVQFTNYGNASSASINSFRSFGTTAAIYAARTSTYVFDIYVAKTEAWDMICINDIHLPHYMKSACILSYPGTHVTSLPSGYIAVSPWLTGNGFGCRELYVNNNTAITFNSTSTTISNVSLPTMYFGSGNRTQIRGNQIYLSSTTSNDIVSNTRIMNISDARMKNNIEELNADYENTDKFIKLWDRICPKEFKMKYNNSKLHIGYVAQDIIGEMEELGFDYENAPIIGISTNEQIGEDGFNSIDENSEYFDELYTVDYNECAMLTTLKLKQVINEILPRMQNEINTLKEQNELLKEQIRLLKEAK